MCLETLKKQTRHFGYILMWFLESNKTIMELFYFFGDFICKSNYTFMVHLLNVYLVAGKKEKDDVEMRQPLVETFPPGKNMNQKCWFYY